MVENYTKEITSPKISTNAYGTKVYEHTNRVSYGWITASAYVQIVTSYQLERNGVDVKITNVKPSSTASGVGAYAAYNGDAKSNNNELVTLMHLLHSKLV